MAKQLSNLIKLPIIRTNLLQYHQQKKQIHLTIKHYAGHSKWQNIRHIKALNDGQRSLQFIKLSRQIRLAAQCMYVYKIKFY